MNYDDNPKKGTNNTSKTISGPAKYKAMVKKTDPDSTAKKEILLVEKPDGRIAQWGNDLPVTNRPLPPVKKQAILSDKARGLSNSYQPARDQQQGPAIKTIKRNYNY